MITALGTSTRHKLVETATRSFAEHGIEKASLLDIARQAGQRNRGAVHYHFGSRTGILVAVLEEHVGFLQDRHAELLAVARHSPVDQLEPIVDALVRPCVELADTGWRGRCFLVVVAELAGADQSSLDPSVAAVLGRTGGFEVYDAILERLPELVPQLPSELVGERLSLMTTFVLRSIADRALAAERPHVSPQLGDEAFTANLVSMITGMLTAPVPAVPRVP